VDFVENQGLRMEDYGRGMTITNILTDDTTLLFCEDLKPKVIIYPSNRTSELCTMIPKNISCVFRTRYTDRVRSDTEDAQSDLFYVRGYLSLSYLCG
jgi:hypothetical protein